MRTYDRFAVFYFGVAWFYRRTLARHQKVVVVVGSFGKTTTTRAIQTALGLSSEITDKNFNYKGLIAWNFLRLPRSQRVAVIEVGITTPGEMSKFVSPLKPDAVVVTCIGDEHIYSFGSREGIRNEKADSVRLLSANSAAFLNGDDPLVRWMAGDTKAKVIWYGFESMNAYRGIHWRRRWPEKSILKIATPTTSDELETDFLSSEPCYSLLAAFAVAAHFGQSHSSTMKNLENMTATVGRLSRVKAPGGHWIIRDDFKATLETIHLALETVKELPARIIMVMGGIDSPRGKFVDVYRSHAKLVASVVDEVILVKGAWRDDFSSEFRRQLRSESRLQFFQKVNSLSEAADLVCLRAKPDDVVLIKGRANENLGRISDRLMNTAGCDVSDSGSSLRNESG